MLQFHQHCYTQFKSCHIHSQGFQSSPCRVVILVLSQSVTNPFPFSDLISLLIGICFKACLLYLGGEGSKFIGFYCHHITETLICKLKQIVVCILLYKVELNIKFLSIYPQLYLFYKPTLFTRNLWKKWWKPHSFCNYFTIYTRTFPLLIKIIQITLVTSISVSIA